MGIYQLQCHAFAFMSFNSLIFSVHPFAVFCIFNMILMCDFSTIFSSVLLCSGYIYVYIFCHFEGLSSGNGIVDLLYSSLSFKLICVNLGTIYSSGGGVGLVFLCLLLIVVSFCLAILDLVPVLVSDSDSDLGSWAGLGPVPGFLFGLLAFNSGFCWFVSSINCLIIISLCLFSFCLLSLIRRASLTWRL